jgi:Carboxypeptidase regulatory-like domain/TonB dependent receptor-like, beta-barrel
LTQKRTLRQLVVALALLVAFLSQATWVLAGTTGRLVGQVTDENGAPIAGAAVKASSSSQTVAATTDAGGHFTFLTLAPDTYTVSVSKDGYNPATYPGVTIFADQSQTLALKLQKGLKTIATVGARASGNLVKSGTTADVYSVNAATQQVVQGIGGGGNLDSAYSAIYSQPGVVSQIGNYGFGQVYYIRGSAYSQVGYEYDGVPVNRAFDNYNANSLSSLGSQETEVYTGGSPAGGTSATLAGYINQVIKTGTFPGYANVNLGIGTPAFYHKAGVEAGGATPDRLFSWYVGVQGTNQMYNTLDNSNGASQPIDGSGPNGIFSSVFNAYASTLSFYPNGTFSTCGVNGPPSGALGYDPSFNLFGSISPLLPPQPSCNIYTPWSGSGFLGLPVNTSDRENVVNFHFGIPHRNDAGRDDVQALYYNFSYHQYFGDSISDQGGLGYINQGFPGWLALDNLLGIPASAIPGGTGPYSNLCAYQYLFFVGCATTGGSTLPYIDTRVFGPGTTFGQSAASANVINYSAPSQPPHDFHAGVPLTGRDTTWNDGSVIKLQYQKNFGSSAYVRVMGYSFYSDWLMSSPNAGNFGITGYGYNDTGFGYPSPDYELNTHTRGIQVMAADQINAQNLLQLTGNYTTASVVRWNNQWYGAPSHPTNFVDANGNCYSLQSGADSNCLLSSTGGTYSTPTGGYFTSSGGFVPYPTSNPCTSPVGNTALKGSPACLAGATTIVTVPDGYGTLNTVTPQFSSIALQDEWRPTDRWDVNAGIRFESYVYNLPSTVNSEFNFWFKQAQNGYCYDPATGQPILIPISPGTPPGNAGPQVIPNTPNSGEMPGLCYSAPGQPYISPSGQQARHPNGLNGSLLYTNAGPSGFSHPLWSPRIGGTYTAGPDDVIRFNYGRYTQPTETAFEQYTNASGLGAAKFDFQHFWGLGFSTPDHNNPVQVSNNYDLSYEKHLKGTDWTFKLSPFYRWTTNQIVTVSLGGNFASGINAATQQTAGVEFAVQKGDPTRNGFSGQLSYTFTSAKIKYSTLANGSNAIDVINNYISVYNGLTKSGGGAPWYCVNGAGPNGTNGPSQTGAGCGRGKFAIQNPYYNTSPQALLDRNGWYDVYANNPPQSSPDTVTQTAINPNVFAGFLNYKHDKFTASLNAILNEGNTYGSPLAVVGLDPRDCFANQGSTVPGIKGTKYGGLANYQYCTASSFAPSGYLAIPNPTSGAFDGLAAYREPWQFNMGLQFGYEVNPRIQLTATLANVLNECFGGTAATWAQAYKPNNIVCAYAPDGYYYLGSQPGAGFFYGANPHAPQNGTAGYPAVFNQVYQPLYNAIPFQVYFTAQVKL